MQLLLPPASRFTGDGSIAFERSLSTLPTLMVRARTRAKVRLSFNCIIGHVSQELSILLALDTALRDYHLGSIVLD